MIHTRANKLCRFPYELPLALPPFPPTTVTLQLLIPALLESEG